MAALFFFTCVILKLSLASGQSVLYVLKGREAILSPALSKAPDDILWKHNGNNVITFDSAEERVFPPYEGRVTLGWGTAELTIADVRYEDSGEYELETFIRDKPSRSQYMLKVLDKVSKPVIRCEMRDEGGNSSSVRRATLLCSSESNTPEALTFKWNLEGKNHLGQALPIALGNEHDLIEYSCTATNPLHGESSVFLAKDCHKVGGAAALDVIVPIVIASLILLAFCIFPFIFRHQIKRACLKRSKIDDLEKQIKAAEYKNKDEGSPLMGNIHRQETLVSNQRLIQQSDFEKETPQTQEITEQLEEPKALRKVKRRSKKFGNHTESQPDTPTDEEDDVGEIATALPSVDSERDTDLSHVAPKSEEDSESADLQPQSPSTDPPELLPRPDEHDDRSVTDAEGGTDLSDHEGVSKTGAAVDSHSIQSGLKEAPEQAVESQTNLGHSVPQENHDFQLMNKGLAEFNEEIKPDEDPVLSQSDPVTTVSQQPESPPRSPQSSSPADSASDSAAFEDEKTIDLVEDTETPSDASLNESLTPEQQAGPQSPLQNSLSSVQDSNPEPESDKEKTNPEIKTDSVDEDPQRDSDSNSDTSDSNGKDKDAALIDEQPTTIESEPPAADSSSSESDHDPKPDPGPSVEEAKGEELDSHDDEEPPKQDSPSEESEESKQTSTIELTPTDDSEQPESQPQSPLQSDLASDQDSKSEPVPEPEDKKKSNPETQPDSVDSQRNSNHQNDSSDDKGEKGEDAASTDLPQPSPDSEPPVDSPSSQSDQNQNPNSGPNVEEAKDHEDLDSRTDEEPPKQDSSSEESEESKQSSTTEITPTDAEQPESQPQSPLESDPASVQLSKPEPEPESEDKEKTSPETKPDSVNSVRNSDNQNDCTDNKGEKAEDAGLAESESLADSPSSQSVQNPDSGLNVEEAKGHEESDSRTDEEPQKQDSSSEESEESKQTSTENIKPTDDSEQPGSEKESTHPPASALSQAAHNKESKDSEAEDASSAQVSEETKRQH